MNNVSDAQKEFIRLGKRNKFKVFTCQIMIFIIFVSGWEITTRIELIDSFIFSSPSRIWNTAVMMFQDGTLFYHTGITLLETIVSFGLVTFIGLFMAVILWLSPTFSNILEPYLVVLNSLPKSALAPLLIVWLGNNVKTIIVAAVSVAVFGTIINTYAGFKGVSKEKVKLIYTLGGTKKDVLFRVILPSNIPNIISLMKVNIGLSLVGVIIGEFLAANAGLGYLIIYGTQVFKLDWVMMSIIILCIIAMGLYKIINIIEKFYLKRF